MTQDHWNIPSEERQRQLGTDVSDMNTLRAAMAFATNPSGTTRHPEAIRRGCPKDLNANLHPNPAAIGFVFDGAGAIAAHYLLSLECV
jgi:hypothetical protein